MIAVEWSDWDAPRDAATNQSLPRTGLLLSIGIGHLDGAPNCKIAYVITQREHWDKETPHSKGPIKVIKAVSLSRIVVKGVHLPFEPYEAEK